MFDWTQGGLDHLLRVLLIDPCNLSTIRGELTGINGGSLMLDYYSDLRMKATITTACDAGASDGWDGTAAFRLVHETYLKDSLSHTEVLGTLLVTDAPWSVDNGMRHTSYELVSTLAGMDLAVPAGNFVAGKGAMAKELMEKIRANTSRRLRFLPDARDYKYGGTVVYPAGTRYLSIMFDVCDRARDRLSVDPDGWVTVGAYTVPSQLGVSWEASIDDDMVIWPEEGNDKTLSMPGRVVVVAKKDNAQVVAAATAPTGARQREGVRGYRLDSVHQLTDMNPFTKARAQALADQYLQTELAANDEIKHGMRYRPLREGMVELLRDGSGARRWMVKSADLDLTTWTWSLTLTGGW